MHPGDQRGFTYVALLFVLALVGVGLAQIGPLLADQAQRDREEELLRIGEETVSAIRSYLEATPGAAKVLPRTWDDLLEDRRRVQLVRHLRRIPRDPLTRSSDWDVIRDDGGAMIGIRSRSEARPFRSTGIVVDGRALPPAATYRGWSFVYEPRVPG